MDLKESLAHFESCTFRRGFTLLESLMAAGLLLIVVVAVTSAITAGQQHALEAKQRIAASLAAEELMGRVSTVDYDDLPKWDGFTQPVGAMLNVAGVPLPQIFDQVGREVQVTTSMKLLDDLDIRIRGRMVRVRGFDIRGRTLADLNQFVPEPQS